MAEVISLMEIDGDDINNHNQSDRFRKLNMGKSVPVSGDPKAITWVEKYRPQSLADVSARRDIIDTVARKLYGEQYSNLILERNASDDRGINVVWQQIQDFASTQCFSFGLDFCDGGKNLTRGKNVVVSGDRKAIPWVEKYRPQSLADIAAHGDIVNTIDSLASENRLPHLLLYGPPGTGKTSTILAVAHKLYAGQYRNMILELNASDDRGIDVVRQQIQDFASTHSFSFGSKASVKLVLLDEADAMTKDAQFALRRVIEKYTKSTRFALICNHLNKIIPALRSRCTLFRFAPLDQIHGTEQLKHVISAEGLDVPEDGLAALVRLSNGDMRKALNILQSTYMASQRITEEAVYLCTGNPMPRDIEQISNWLLIEPFVNSFKGISEMKAMKGLALIDIVRELTMFIFNKRPSYVRAPLINDLADIEYRLCCGCNEKMQLGSLISSFMRARSAT